jgi:hypothetical protein
MLNYSISLAKHDMLASSREKFQQFLSLYKNNKSEELAHHEKDIKEAIKNMNQLLS